MIRTPRTNPAPCPVCGDPLTAWAAELRTPRLDELWQAVDLQRRRTTQHHQPEHVSPAVDFDRLASTTLADLQRQARWGNTNAQRWKT